MNLLRKMATWVRSLSLTSPSGWSEARYASDAGEVVTQDSALAISTVWSCVNLISGIISTLPVAVHRERNGIVEPMPDHPLTMLLDQSPNYDQTSVDFWDFLAASVELRGNGFARIEKLGDRPVALTPVNPAWMQVKRLESGALEYRWSADGKSYRETDATMLHIRGFGGDPLGGMSTLHFARQTLGLTAAVNKAASSMFANGMRPSGVLSLPNWLPPEKRDETRALIEKDFVGAHNAGRPFLAEGGIKWDSLSINPEDAQMLESRSFSVEELCRFFNVPPPLVGHTVKSSSWPTSLEQQVLAFLKFSLRRRIKRIEKACEKRLLTAGERATGLSIHFNIDALLRADIASRMTSYQTGLQNGFYLINEVRRLENLPPIPGGDVARMQSQNIPITAATGLAPPAPPAADEDEDEEEEARA